MELSPKKIAYFNFVYNRATARMEKIVFADGYNNKALGFFDKRKLKKSIRQLEECLTMAPQHFQTMVFIAKAHQRMGEHQKAFAHLEKAYTIEPGNKIIPTEASLEAMHLQMLDKALFYSAAAVKLEENDVRLLGNHAMNLLIAAQDEEAKRTIEKALKLDPKDEVNRNVERMIKGVMAGIKERPTFKSAVG